MALSSLVLAQRAEPARSQADGADADPLQFQGQRVTPAIDASFPAGAQPFVFFVAYPDRSKTDAPKIGVQFLLDGKEIASQTADLRPRTHPGGADDHRSHRETGPLRAEDHHVPGRRVGGTEHPLFDRR